MAPGWDSLHIYVINKFIIKYDVGVFKWDNRLGWC